MTKENKEIKNRHPETFLDKQANLDEDYYYGNIFGWKTSIIGLIVLVVSIGVITWGQLTGRIDIWNQEFDPMPIEVVRDSLNN